MTLQAYEPADTGEPARKKRRLRDPLATIPRDSGCGGACVKSLECPYEVCRYDDPHRRIVPSAFDGMTMKERHQKIRDLREQGVTAREIARSLMVTVRTVYRILDGRYD